MYGLVEDDIEDSYSDVNAIAMSTRKLQEDNTIDDAMPKEETSEVESKVIGVTKKWLETFHLFHLWK